MTLGGGTIFNDNIPKITENITIINRLTTSLENIFFFVESERPRFHY